MSRNCSKAIAVVLCIFLLLPGSSFSAVAPSSIGILRVGELLSTSQEKAYEVVEKRLELWLERHGYQGPKVKTLEASYTVQQVRMEADRARLLRSSDRLWRLVHQKDKGEAAVVFSQVQSYRKAAEKFPRFGPAVQKAHLAEAAYLLMHGDPKAAEVKVNKAVALHPDLKIEGIVDWRTSSLASFIEKAKSQTRMCTLELSISPPGSEVSVNGFEVGGRRVFSLAGGADFIVGARSRGFHGYHRIFRCQRQHSRKLIVRLNRDASQWTNRQVALDQISHRHEVQSLFLISPVGDEFQLFLYTPGLSIDRVPTSRPIRVAEVVGDPMAVEVPIKTDAFKVIYKRHETAEPFYLPEPISSSRVESIESTVSLEPAPAWYSRWTTWAIAAGVVGGVVFAMTRSRSRVESTDPNIRNGIQIRF